MTASYLMVMFALGPWFRILGTRMVRFENVGMRYGSGPEVLRDV